MVFSRWTQVLATVHAKALLVAYKGMVAKLLTNMAKDRVLSCRWRFALHGIVYGICKGGGVVGDLTHVGRDKALS